MRATETAKGKSGWKKKFLDELIEYLINFVYLALFFGVFAWYGRLLLAQFQISYLDYGVALIEALILAKVVMIGDILGLGRRLGNKSLIFTILYKAILFTVWADLFTVLEYALGGLWHGRGFLSGLATLFGPARMKFLAQSLVVFWAFIPFFATKEMVRLFGREKVRKIFFEKGLAGGPESL